VTHRTKDGRTVAQAWADRFVRRVRAEWDSYEPEVQREIRLVKRMAVQGNARALVAYSHNAGKSGSLSMAQAYGAAIVILKGWTQPLTPRGSTDTIRA